MSAIVLVLGAGASRAEHQAKQQEANTTPPPLDADFLSILCESASAFGCRPNLSARLTDYLHVGDATTESMEDVFGTLYADLARSGPPSVVASREEADVHVFVAASSLSSRLFSGWANREYWGIVDKVRTAIKDKGYRIASFIWDDPRINKGDEDAQKYKTETSHKFYFTGFSIFDKMRDPCMKGFVFFGHGAYTGERGWWNKKSGAKYTGQLSLAGREFGHEYLETLDHDLDFILLFACGAGVEDGWANYVGSPDDVVSTPGAPAVGGLNYQGATLGNRMVEAVERSPGAGGR